MIAKREIWNYSAGEQVWVGKYKNSHNLLHWHPDCELLFVEKGKINIFCEGKTYSLETGQSFFIDSEQVHYMHATERDTVLVVIIFNYSIIRSFAESMRLASPVLTGDYGIPKVYSLLRDELLQKKPFYAAQTANYILKTSIDIFRNEKLIAKSESANDATLAFKQLLEEINTRYRYITFEDAADFMSMSPAYFSRYFHSAAGITFTQQLNSVKTNAAVKLLLGNTELSMTEIADACGFGTIRNFNRIFKSLTGYTPRELPKDYSFNERLSYLSERTFDPTLIDCELIEST